MLCNRTTTKSQWHATISIYFLLLHLRISCVVLLMIGTFARLGSWREVPAQACSTGGGLAVVSVRVCCMGFSFFLRPSGHMGHVLLMAEVGRSLREEWKQAMSPENKVRNGLTFTLAQIPLAKASHLANPTKSRKDSNSIPRERSYQVTGQTAWPEGGVNSGEQQCSPPSS